MFNLLIFTRDWESETTAKIPIERVFEHTEPTIRNKYEDNTNKLIEFPCLFCNEGMGEEVVHVGYITNISIEKSFIEIKFTLDRDIDWLTNGLIYEYRNTFGIDNEFEFSRNHWAIKKIDLYKILLKISNRKHQKPSVFKLPKSNYIDPNKAAVMMPFSAEFNDTYKAIKAAFNDIAMECNRADDIWENETIIQDIFDLIYSSNIIVCDCSKQNANVFYEIGIAHTLGRNVILLTQNESDIPFDLRHLRYIHYHNNEEGRFKLTRNIRYRINKINKNSIS